MKSILYVSAGLMISASVYGFVDYSQTKNNLEFSKMYESADVRVEPVIRESGGIITQVAKKEQLTKQESIAIKKQDRVGSEVKKVTSKNKRSKSISAELFSRAPLKQEHFVNITTHIKADTLAKEETKEL
jgi:hypothetical protein